MSRHAIKVPAFGIHCAMAHRGKLGKGSVCSKAGDMIFVIILAFDLTAFLMLSL